MSTDLSDLMAEDSQSPLNLPSNEGLGGVQKLANDILAAQLRVENLEADLKAAKQTLLKLTDEDLPSQMTEIGLTNFTLADGSKVDIKETYGARIKKADEGKAFDWLRAHGEGDIIKNTVTVRFAVRFLIDVDSSTTIMQFGLRFTNHAATSGPFLVEKASTFITNILRCF